MDIANLIVCGRRRRLLNSTKLKWIIITWGQLIIASQLQGG